MKKSILLVEDEAILAMSEKIALEQYGYSVKTVNTGEKAVEAVKSSTEIDVILMDINLGSGIDGTEAAEMILKDHDIPIVFVSSHSEREVVEKTEKITSYGYVVKSSSITVLDASIKMAFKLFKEKEKSALMNNKLEATIHALPDAMFELDLDGYIYYIHTSNPDFLFLSSSFAIGKKIQNILPAEVVEVIMSAITEAYTKGISLGRQYKLHVPIGTRWFEISVSPVASYPDRPHFILLRRDITERKELEEKSTMANEMFQKVLDSIPEYIGWKNSESVFLGCNKNFSDKFGLQDTDSIIGKTDHDIFTEKFEIEKFIKDDKKVIETDIPLSHMTEINTDHDGNVTFIDVNKTPLHDVNGKVNGILITALDITEKIKHVQELENEQFLRKTLIDGSTDYIFFKDTKSRFLMANNALAKYFGLRDPSEILGKTDFDFFPPKYAQGKYDDEQNVISTGMASILEEEQRTINGESQWVLTQKWVLKTNDGDTMGVFGYSRNITDRKLMEDALVKERYLFHTLLDNVSDYIYFKDTEHRFIKASNAHAKYFGFADSRLLIGKTDYDLLSEENAKQTYEDEEHVMKNRIAIRKEEKIILTNNKSSWFLTEKLPLMDENKKIVGVFGITRNISAIKEYERILFESKNMLRNILDTIPQSVFWKDKNSVFLGCNQVFAELLGFTNPEEIIGKSDFEIPALSKNADHFIKDDNSVMVTKQPKKHIIEQLGKTKKKMIWVETTKVPLLDEQKKAYGVLGVFDDITERKEIEEKLRSKTEELKAQNERLMSSEELLRHSESQFSLFMDYLPAIAFLKDSDGKTIFTNKYMNTVIGSSGWKGKTMTEVFPNAFGEQLLADDMSILKYGYKRIEEPIPHIDGTIHYYETQKFTISKSNNERLIGGVSLDITERKKAEEKIKSLLAEKELILLEVHHRIKNNMSVMMSLLSLQEYQMKVPEDKMIIRDAENQLRGMGLLYDRLYRSANYREMNASEYLPSLVKEIVNTFPKNKKIQILTNIDDFMISIKTLSPLGIIINELITNVMKYAFVDRGKGEIILNARKEMKTVHMEICDNGIGMPESVSFENSSGFGLMLIGSLAKQLEGNIWIERGVGTKVILEFED